MTRSLNFNVGLVKKVGDGIAVATGLDGAMAGELVFFPKSGVQGLVLNLYVDRVAIVILGNERYISQDDVVERTGTVVTIPVT